MPTGIPYCDETLNVTAGCTKCSPGCENCWAEKWAYRLSTMGKAPYDLVQEEGCWNGNIEMMPWNLDKPLHWRKPKRIFVCSMSDLFHPKVRFKFITRMHDRIDVCQQHTFLIFTKRIERAKEYYLDELGGRISENIQLILSISTQKEADEKIPILLQIPAAVRGLSIEPMLEGIDLAGKDKSRMGKTGYLANYFTPYFCNNCGRHISKPPDCVISTCRYCGGQGKGHRREKSLHWVVVGSESGPGARYCDIENIRSVVRQCQVANVPVFVKQIHLNGKAKAIKNINEFPKDLRIQQLP